jgi:uncharacterized protein YerC
MAHIAKDPIEEELYQKLFSELQKLLIKSDSGSVGKVLDSLLTSTEQIMLTKRLAIILFLHKGMTEYEIWHTLKMSSSTVARVHGEYKTGAYDPIIKVISKNTAKDFLKLLEIILGAGLPPRSKDRWQHVAGFGRTK